MKVSHPLILKLALLLALLAFPSLDMPFYMDLVGKTLLFGLFAMSLDLLVGFTGLASLGHAAFFGIATYVVALMTPKYEAASFWLTFPCAILISALSAMLVGVFVLRTKGIYFIMVTLAFSQMAYYIFHDTKLGGGSDGIYLNAKPDASIYGNKLLDLDQPLHLYYLIVTVLVLGYLFLARILKSPFGRVLVGIRSNEHRMKSLGYATFYYKLGAFTIAGGVAGAAGYLYAVLFGFVTPELLSWHQSANVLLMVILGGMGHLGGAFAGAVVFIVAQEVFSSITKHWQLAMGLFIVMAVLFLPGGLAAIPRRVRVAFLGGEGDE